MKFRKSLFTLSIATILYTSLGATPNHDNIITLTETYNEPKNIGFAAFVGGSSHIVWVLTILDELKDRGHNVTFFTKDDSVRFGKSFPGINTISVGAPPDLNMDSAFVGLEEKNSDKSVKLVVSEALQKYWSIDYQNMLSQLKEKEIDLMICDFFVDACYDAAKTLGIPFIITTTVFLTPEADAPYVNSLGMTVEDFSTEYQGIFRRFYDVFLEPFEILLKFGGLFKRTAAAKKALGVNSPMIPYEAWQDSIKLVNSFFGLQPPRPMGPLVEQIGPLIPRNYASLNDDLKNYLGRHQKVVYVSFGQHATPSQNTIKLVLTSLLENFESGDIDGIVWAVVNSKKSFPDSITTSSKTKYLIADIFAGKYPDIRFDSWTPQVAILIHPSTHLFVSHGGHGSCLESMYAGVPMVIVPSFADQFGNALAIQRANLGISARLPMSSNKLTNEIRKVISDKDGKIKAGLKRTQAIVQIRSRHGPKIGADVVEEVIFSHINGEIPHRYPASRRLSFLRAHNIDLYIMLITFLLSITVGTFYTVKYVRKYYVKNYGAKSKTKTL